MSEYYTPSIEEFHVGFEFEKLEGLEWFSHNIPPHYRVFSLGDELTNYRVKYLDKEDIESLGFTYNSKSIDLWFYKEGNFDLGSWTAYKIILQYGLHDNRLRMYADDPGNGDYVLFVGIIKNKSELKVLMKQIGIYE